jgi:predicted solute-binding protein
METPAPCRLALWDDEALGAFAADLAEACRRFGVTIERLPRTECEQRLSAGLVEAALVPTVSVLSAPDAYDVYPTVAVSAWCTPHASIHLRDGLERQPGTLSCAAGLGQERLMARIVLREHYGMQPAVVEAAVGDETDAAAGSVLRVGPLLVERNPTAPDEPGITLDLGQEWFELTAYPMVWALIASRVGESDDRMFLALKEAVGPSGDESDVEEPITELVSDTTLRFRMDDVATASLTELADLLFFYKVTEDVPALRFAPDPEAPPAPEPDDDDDAEFRI